MVCVRVYVSLHNYIQNLLLFVVSYKHIKLPGTNTQKKNSNIKNPTYKKIIYIVKISPDAVLQEICLEFFFFF